MRKDQQSCKQIIDQSRVIARRLSRAPWPSPAAPAMPAPTRPGGAIGGAVIGGLIGSQFGRGGGRLAMTAFGTLAGAAIGSSIGKRLDDADRARMREAEMRAYGAPLNQQIVWNNPDNGHSGTIVPTREGHRPDGQYCREFQSDISVGGQHEKGYGTACQQLTTDPGESFRNCHATFQQPAPASCGLHGSRKPPLFYDLIRTCRPCARRAWPRSSPPPP